MTYISLYRKYRPQKFEEVVGQNIIVKILINSIANNKIGHAYIFSGPRGTGKTSVAKIFAKAVNCTNFDGEVCNNCDNCLSANENNLDIIEIDAASNNGVDEIREIKNNSKLLPSKLKYRVYIIDEVHMLSNSAFNALLKTLEEPPSHIIFILATTEINKIPATVLSRCQKFEFKKISEKEIYNRLKTILDIEKINLDDDILKLISELSDGGLRDAINLLDQLISLNKKEITRTDVFNLLGSLSDDELFELFDNIIDCNIENILKIINKYVEDCKNFNNLIYGLQNIIKNLMIYNNTYGYFDDQYENKLQKYLKLDFDKIYQMSDELFNLNYESKRNNLGRITMEIYLIKIAMLFKKDEKTDKVAKDDSVLINEENDNKVEKQNENIRNIIINNALSLANKQLKKDFVDNYSSIKDYLLDKKYNYISNLLVKAQPEVVSEKEIIFTVSNDFEIVLFEKNEDEIKKLLKKVYKKNYNIVALKNEEWDKIKNDYIKNIKNGVKYEYIDLKKVKNIAKKEELENNVEDIFGDNYKIEN